MSDLEDAFVDGWEARARFAEAGIEQPTITAGEAYRAYQDALHAAGPLRAQDGEGEPMTNDVRQVVEQRFIREQAKRLVAHFDRPDGMDFADQDEIRDFLVALAGAGVSSPERTGADQELDQCVDDIAKEGFSEVAYQFANARNKLAESRFRAVIQKTASITREFADRDMAFLRQAVGEAVKDRDYYEQQEKAATEELGRLRQRIEVLEPPAQNYNRTLERAEKAEADLAEARHEMRQHVQQRITTRCPSCGHQSLFIGSGGHLTCSWLECKDPGLERAIAKLTSPPAPSGWQQRVQEWMLACFGPAITSDRLERCDRFAEEAIELLQALGYDRNRLDALTDYVYCREAGEPGQEVGGVMVTLAALCSTHGIDVDTARETELSRVWTKVEHIREKQKAKPTNSALPVAPGQHAKDALPSTSSAFSGSSCALTAAAIGSCSEDEGDIGHKLAKETR